MGWLQELIQQSNGSDRCETAHNNEFEYLEFKDGDHFLSSAEHRLVFFKAMERFLARYLGKQDTKNLETAAH